jgi:hypothetical protein
MVIGIHIVGLRKKRSTQPTTNVASIRHLLLIFLKKSAIPRNLSFRAAGAVFDSCGYSTKQQISPLALLGRNDRVGWGGT